MKWIIGGTKDSRDFVNLLKENSYDLNKVIISVATNYGKKLIDELNCDLLPENKINIIAEPMDAKKMATFIEEYGITEIFDFSHPYAIEVSQNAINSSNIKNIKYFRFERKNLSSENAIDFYNIDELISFLATLNGNILVTLGSNNIEKFSNLQNIENIYFRVLPVTISIKKLENIGIKAKNIIGLQGPFSTSFNEAIYKNYNIKYMVTKESGITGGEKEKLDAAKNLDVTPIILKRPKIHYPWVSSSLKIILNKFL